MGLLDRPITPEERERAIARLVAEERKQEQRERVEKAFAPPVQGDRSYLRPAAPLVRQIATYQGATLRAEEVRRRASRGYRFDGATIVGSLYGAYLEECSFVGCDLRPSDMTEARLTGACLRGARLDGVSLRAAQLDHADLTGASLVGADLARARLVGATLTSTDLTNAKMTGVDLRNVTR